MHACTRTHRLLLRLRGGGKTIDKAPRKTRSKTAKQREKKMEWERAAAILEMGSVGCMWLDEKGLPRLSRVRARKSIHGKCPRKAIAKAPRKD